MSRTIGGQLDYHRLANQYRPTDGAALAAEVLRLNAAGLTPMDISGHLRLPLAWVLETVSRGSFLTTTT